MQNAMALKQSVQLTEFRSRSVSASRSLEAIGSACRE